MLFYDIYDQWITQERIFGVQDYDRPTTVAGELSSAPDVGGVSKILKKYLRKLQKWNYFLI